MEHLPGGTTIYREIGDIHLFPTITIAWPEEWKEKGECPQTAYILESDSEHGG
jgi:hypothetical protein